MLLRHPVTAAPQERESVCSMAGILSVCCKVYICCYWNIARCINPASLFRDSASKRLNAWKAKE